MSNVVASSRWCFFFGCVLPSKTQPSERHELTKRFFVRPRSGVLRNKWAVAQSGPRANSGGRVNIKLPKTNICAPAVSRGLGGSKSACGLLRLGSISMAWDLGEIGEKKPSVLSRWGSPLLGARVAARIEIYSRKICRRPFRGQKVFFSARGFESIRCQCCPSAVDLFTVKTRQRFPLSWVKASRFVFRNNSHLFPLCPLAIFGSRRGPSRGVDPGQVGICP